MAEFWETHRLMAAPSFYLTLEALCYQLEDLFPQT